jgi:hypothetical protein
VSSTRRLHLAFPPAAGSDSNEELGHAATAPDRGSRLHRPTPIRRIHATRSAKATVNDSACTLPSQLQAEGRSPHSVNIGERAVGWLEATRGPRGFHRRSGWTAGRVTCLDGRLATVIPRARPAV